jgi:hypothetical protein
MVLLESLMLHDEGWWLWFGGKEVAIEKKNNGNDGFCGCFLLD